MHPLRPTANRRFNELIGLLILVLAALLLLALVSYHPSDPSFDTAAVVTRPANWVGPVGANVADVLFQTFGLASFLLVLGLACLARNWFRAPRSVALHRSHVIGLFLSMLALAALIAELPWPLLWRGSVPWHGLVGEVIAAALIAAFNPVGAYVITATSLIAGAFLATRFSFAATAQWWSETVLPWLRPRFAPLLAPWAAMAGRWRAWRQERAQLRQQRALSRRQHERAPEAAPPAPGISATFIPAAAAAPPVETAAARARRAAAAVAAGDGTLRSAQREAGHSLAEAPASIAIHLREVAPVPNPKTPRTASGQYRTPA
ncbi:MAG: DNA translocase FtsK 4TM domain-containing protein, partial [Terriglobales bacterium]